MAVQDINIVLFDESRDIGDGAGIQLVASEIMDIDADLGKGVAGSITAAQNAQLERKARGLEGRPPGEQQPRHPMDGRAADGALVHHLQDPYFSVRHPRIPFIDLTPMMYFEFLLTRMGTPWMILDAYCCSRLSNFNSITKVLGRFTLRLKLGRVP